jgi:hypothetical protein
MTLFDCLKDIINTKSGKLHLEPGFKKAWSNYMIVRYLSMDDRFFEISQIANNLQSSMSPEQMYLFLVKVIPRSHRSFIKYITKPKKA